ncbi:hypothetical protein [Nocardioides rubriscoriae]|uniref:hypothetical protein n=1 Tax=Nocardioides rubriscoriae TaxID=642762 RepID=UPI0011DFD2E4|nr:hypothetical protein [Nocardioides rubriscoriae]
MSDGDLPLPVFADPTGVLTGLELLLFTTPDDWVAEINKAEDAIVAGVKEGISKVHDRVCKLGFWDLVGIGVISPGLGITAALGQGILGDKLEGIAQDVFDKLDELWDAVQAAVDALIGNPAKLFELGTRYLSAKESLESAVFDAEHEKGQLAKYWGGLGFTAFGEASREQVAAMTVMADKMGAAAKLMASAAQALKQAWSNIVQALLALASDIVSKIASGLDLGNILTGDSGPILSLISSALNLVNACTKAIRDINLNADTVGAMDWMSLGSSKAFKGGTSWPPIDPDDSSQYSDSGSWTN